MHHVYEVSILGATPAGYAAAFYLAGHGRDVIVIDSPREPVECPLADWTPSEFFRTPGLPKSLAKLAVAEPFTDVIFHNAAMDQEAIQHGRKVAGYFLPAGNLVTALAMAAGKAGAKTRSMTISPAIRLEEDSVVILGNTQVHAKLMIVAQNRPEQIFSELAIPGRNVPASPIMAAALEVPLPARSPARKLTGQLHIVQLPMRGELGMYFATSSAVHIRVIRGRGAPAGHAAELSLLVGNLQKSGLLPCDLPLGKARGAVWHPPAGVALELETHVAKRTLLTSSAGGFADSITGATISPSVKSALLGAQIALPALDSPDTQNALTQFKSSWRKPLAEHLRPPNTSLSMLLPLLFVNSRLVTKFAHALLHGQSIRDINRDCKQYLADRLQSADHVPQPVRAFRLGAEPDRKLPRSPGPNTRPGKQ